MSVRYRTVSDYVRMRLTKVTSKSSDLETGDSLREYVKSQLGIEKLEYLDIVQGHVVELTFKIDMVSWKNNLDGVMLRMAESISGHGWRLNWFDNAKRYEVEYGDC